jgi:hypothetical protein
MSGSMDKLYVETEVWNGKHLLKYAFEIIQTNALLNSNIWEYNMHMEKNGIYGVQCWNN